MKIWAVSWSIFIRLQKKKKGQIFERKYGWKIGEDEEREKRGSGGGPVRRRLSTNLFYSIPISYIIFNIYDINILNAMCD